MKLSIITVNLNNKNGLRKTIESVVKQTFKSFEFIIIDGGSTDGSVDIIKKAENYITYWVSESDLGIYNAMNKGILQSQGEYLQFLNSGDWLFDDNILETVFSNNKTTDIIYGDAYLIKSDESKYLYTLKPIENITMAFFLTETILHQSSFIKKELFKNTLYDETLRIVSDWKFYIQKVIFQNCTLEYINLAIVNVNSQGISNDPIFIPVIQKEKETVLQSILPSRIRADYDKIKPLHKKNSFNNIDLLNNTQGFQKLVLFVVNILVNTYKILKKITG